MAKKWKFLLTLFDPHIVEEERINFEGELVNVREKGYHKIFSAEITGLSAFQPQGAEQNPQSDWSSVDNPMRLYTYIKKVGDANNLYFQVKWGLDSTYLLKARKNNTEFSLAHLSVLRISQSVGHKENKKRNKSDIGVKLLTIKMNKAKVVQSGHIVKGGYDWFSMKFQSSYPVFD